MILLAPQILTRVDTAQDVPHGEGTKVPLLPHGRHSFCQNFQKKQQYLACATTGCRLPIHFSKRNQNHQYSSTALYPQDSSCQGQCLACAGLAEPQSAAKSCHNFSP